jgi:hypothetical protein
MNYSVRLTIDTGGCYLSVKDKTSWKTKAVAVRHARDIASLINKGKNIYGAYHVEVEDEFGFTVVSFKELSVDKLDNESIGE